jgi:hypothetical protein
VTFNNGRRTQKDNLTNKQSSLSGATEEVISDEQGVTYPPARTLNSSLFLMKDDTRDTSKQNA